MATKQDLLLFFDRPMEPCFMKKGEESKSTVFTIPDHYYPAKYEKVPELSDRFGSDAGRTIQVNNIALPDFSHALQLPYNENFSLFVEAHRKMAAKLIDIFLGMRNVDDLISACAYCQLRINPYMFNYCLSVAMLHRPDTKGVPIPTFAESFPDKFMDPKVIRKVRQVTNTSTPGNTNPITIPQNFTASPAEPEQAVAYFREDIGVNLHHWHWHLVYPFDSADRTVVNKDRRGELFYYMHQQLIARYNVERMCNNLGTVTRFNNFRVPIAEGYFPKLDSQVASRAWPPRFENTTISDINRPVDLIKGTVNQLEIWRDRVREAAETGIVIMPNNSRIQLTEATGIDILGNLVESSIISVNRTYYGDLHNMGHIFIAYAHDPDSRHLERFCVMGDVATAMRDPVFYRWHSYLDDIFVSYKKRLTPYSTSQLNFPGITCQGIRVEGSGGANTFQTHWEQSTVNLGRGLDFTPRGEIRARYTHLQHDEFNYVIKVNNATGRSVQAAFRIFMAPVKDQAGNPYSFDDQRRLMIELDKFNQPLKAGMNEIRHRSQDSSVTIPYERTFQDQNARPGDAGSATAAEFDFCGCGWPQHMLIPKGTKEGYPMVLFVMISDWDQDKVPQDISVSCNDASSYCGIRDRKYPDRKAMGYPFDRRGRPAVSNLGDFLTPNMAVTACTVKFTDATKVRGQTS